jgi:hypothetical protein
MTKLGAFTPDRLGLEDTLRLGALLCYFTTSSDDRGILRLLHHVCLGGRQGGRQIGA